MRYKILNLIKNDKVDIGKPTGKKPIDNDAVKPIITELFDLMESDLAEALSRLEDLAEQLADSDLDEKYKLLENQLNNFDIPAASDTLKSIVKALNLSTGEGG